MQAVLAAVQHDGIALAYAAADLQSNREANDLSVSLSHGFEA